MRLYKRKGSPKYWVDWRDQNGKRHRKSTGTENKQLAEALAAKWTQESFMEQHFGKIPDSPFRDAVLRYGKEKKRENPVGYEDNTRFRLQLLLDHFGTFNLTDIRYTTIQDFADMRLETVKEATVQKELATLKAILNKAHREERLANVPPFPKAKALQGRCRWLTVNEETRLLEAASAHLRPLIVVAVDTGGRRSELLGLDWRHVNLEKGLVTFVKTKNGEDRTIRLTQRARLELKKLGPKESGPVFTYNGKAMRDTKSSFANARRKAGIEDLRFHDLRHTFASRLVQQGVSLYEVMHLTGHKSVSMVQRYAHLAPDFQERAISALEAYGHKMGTAENISDAKTRNPLKRMVGATGIEPVTPAV